MTVTADQWLSNSLLAVEDLLANSATFRALMGAGSVAAARGKIYWQSTRSLPAAPYCVIKLGNGSESEPANRLVQHVDQVGIYLVWAQQKQVGDTEKDASTRELNSFGNLLKEIRDNINTGTYLVRARRTFEPPERTDDKADCPDCWDATITFTWEI